MEKETREFLIPVRVTFTCDTGDYRTGFAKKIYYVNVEDNTAIEK